TGRGHLQCDRTGSVTGAEIAAGPAGCLSVLVYLLALPLCLFSSHTPPSLLSPLPLFFSFSPLLSSPPCVTLRMIWVTPLTATLLRPLGLSLRCWGSNM